MSLVFAALYVITISGSDNIVPDGVIVGKLKECFYVSISSISIVSVAGCARCVCWRIRKRCNRHVFEIKATSHVESFG
jgi:hypothetical protein